MKATRFTESQIVQAIKEYEGGKKAEGICRDLGITKNTFYNRKKKYAGLDGDQLRRLEELEEENRKLKTLYADAALDNKMLKDLLSNRQAGRKVVEPDTVLYQQ